MFQSVLTIPKELISQLKKNITGRGNCLTENELKNLNIQHGVIINVTANMNL